MARPVRIRTSILLAGLAIEAVGLIVVIVALLSPDVAPYRLPMLIAGPLPTIAGSLVMLRARR